MNRQLLGLAGALLIACPLALAQNPNLYSRAIDNPSPTTNTLRLSFSIENATPSAAFAISANTAAPLSVSAPASVSTDARGYARFIADVTTASANSAPRSLTVTVTGPGGFSVTRDFLLQAVNNEVVSAFPQVLMVLGAFCSPTSSAANQLQISRDVDLNGDGFYGDRFSEAIPSVDDKLDNPNELTSDINACFTGVDEWLPGTGAIGANERYAAFATDVRVVNQCASNAVGSCNFTTDFNFVQELDFSANFNSAGPALFFVGSSADVAHICRDTDGSGKIEAGEISVFFDPSALIAPNNQSPDGISADPSQTNRIYWISDSGGTPDQGLIQLTDANFNDVIGAGEFTQTWTTSSPAVTVDTVVITPDNFEGVVVDSGGAVLVNDNTNGVIHRWVDGAGGNPIDGIAQTGEVLNFLGYDTGANPLFTKNVDFVAMTLGFPNFNGNRNNLNFLCAVPSLGTGGRDLYVIGSDEFSNPMTRGYVLVCDDINGDGDVNDMNEVVVMVNGQNLTSPVRGALPSNMTGMDCTTIDYNGDGAITRDELVVVTYSPVDGVMPHVGAGGQFGFSDGVNWLFRDIDGDGAADQRSAVIGNEYEIISVNATGAFNRGLALMPGPAQGGFGLSWYNRSLLVPITAAGCTNAIGNYLTIDHSRDKREDGTQGTPFLGNGRFEIVVSGANPTPSPGGIANIGIVFGFSNINWLGIPLPINGAVIGSDPLCDVNISQNITLTGAPNASGEFVLGIPIPNDATLTGSTFWVEPFEFDLNLALALPVVWGESAEVRMF